MRAVALVGLAGCVVSCGSGGVSSASGVTGEARGEAMVADVSPTEWRGAVSVTYSNSDTLTLRDIDLALRHSVEVWPRHNTLIVERMAPSGARTQEVVDVAIDVTAAQASRLHETVTRLHSEFRFDEVGDYRFTVSPLRPVAGIWSSSIEITKNGKR